jgi:hypothetical protein
LPVHDRGRRGHHDSWLGPAGRCGRADRHGAGGSLLGGRRRSSLLGGLGCSRLRSPLLGGDTGPFGGGGRRRRGRLLLGHEDSDAACVLVEDALELALRPEGGLAIPGHLLDLCLDGVGLSLQI